MVRVKASLLMKLMVMSSHLIERPKSLYHRRVREVVITAKSDRIEIASS